MKQPLIKICGITNLDDADCALGKGVDFIGFCFVHDSVRYIAPDCAEWLVKRLEGEVRKVGVFVNTPVAKIQAIAEQCRLDIIQLHGDESPEIARELGAERVWKALAIWDEDDLNTALSYPAAAILVDSMTEGQRGGTGKVGNWQLTARLAHQRPVVLAGGLTPANVAEAIETVNPYAVDVCSGIEKHPGVKDFNRLAQFVKNVRRLGTAL